jgi:hypothetical protein
MGMKRIYEKQDMNTALSLVVALGAYCPRVKSVGDEKTLLEMQMKAKRRTRPMIGRGTTSKFLMAHFAEKRMKDKKAKAKRAETLRLAA